MGTWVCVPTTAVTLPSRYQPSATFSLVTSACMSTRTRSARETSFSAASMATSGGAAACRWTMPERFTTPRLTPPASTIVVPRPGWVGRKLYGRTIRRSSSR